MWYQALAEAGRGHMRIPLPVILTQVDAARLPAADASDDAGCPMSAGTGSSLSGWIPRSATRAGLSSAIQTSISMIQPIPISLPIRSIFWPCLCRSPGRTESTHHRLGERQTCKPSAALIHRTAEFAFTVHGTMADPRWLDPSVEPSDRAPGVCYLGDPKVVNDGPVGSGTILQPAQLAEPVEHR